MKYEIVREAFDNQPLYDIDGYKFVLNSLTEQIPATSSVLLRLAGEWLAESIPKCDKLLTEEDKGGILVAAVSLHTGFPFGMARWYPNQLADQISSIFTCEYVKEGTLYLNGIEKGDNVVIIDDMISTGGTMIGIIKTLQSIGANIVEIVVLAEKIEYKGIQRVKKETGFDVRSLVRISIAGQKSKVLND
ncbi:MAG: phosphoribosyltransferase family protein [Promethearchaeota archaeon]|jgi:adenine/guanine phosphoribosyltransferase-like PRPP-binding protein